MKYTPGWTFFPCFVSSSKWALEVCSLSHFNIFDRSVCVPKNTDLNSFSYFESFPGKVCKQLQSCRVCRSAVVCYARSQKSLIGMHENNMFLFICIMSSDCCSRETALADGELLKCFNAINVINAAQCLQGRLMELMRTKRENDRNNSGSPSGLWGKSGVECQRFSSLRFFYSGWPSAVHSSGLKQEKKKNMFCNHSRPQMQ